MTREEQAKIILREIDEVYSVSTYMEKYVINAIMAGLDEIYSKEEKDRIDEKWKFVSVLPVVLEVTGRNISQKKREDKHVKSNDSKSTGRTAGRIKDQSGQAGTDKKCADPEYFMGLDQKRKGEGEEWDTE